MIYKNDILSQLGKRLGLELSFDENQQCCLMLDQSLMISIKKQATAWIFYGMLQATLDEQGEAFWKHLLMFNLSLAEQQAGTITYESVSGALLYVDSLPITELEINTSYTFLEEFVNRLERVKEQVLSIPKATDNVSDILRGRWCTLS